VWHGVVVHCVPDAYRCSTVGGHVALARKLGVCKVMQSVLLIKIQLGRQLASTSFLFAIFTDREWYGESIVLLSAHGRVSSAPKLMSRQ